MEKVVVKYQNEISFPINEEVKSYEDLVHFTKLQGVNNDKSTKHNDGNTRFTKAYRTHGYLRR